MDLVLVRHVSLTQYVNLALTRIIVTSSMRRSRSRNGSGLMAKVDKFVPETQDVNLKIVCRPLVAGGDRCKRSRHGSSRVSECE